MIVNIRGTNGSGKSTLVRQFMSYYGATPHDCDERNRERGYVVNTLGYQARSQEPLITAPNSYIVGRYATACGGCDTIKTQAETKERIQRYAANGNVVFEGILVSTIFGPWLEFSRSQGGMVWAFLDTPLELCLQRVQIRNGGQPVKEDQIAAKYDGMIKIAHKAKEAGEQVITLNHIDPLPDLLAVMGLC